MQTTTKVLRWPQLFWHVTPHNSYPAKTGNIVGCGSRKQRCENFSGLTSG